MATRNTIVIDASPLREADRRKDEFLAMLAQELRNPLAPVEFTPAPIEKPSRIAPRDILIVDDNRDAADTLGMVLKHHGHSTAVSYSGPEALEKLEQQTAEVVLLDISMPQMDGFETAKQIRSRPDGRQVVIIALTGYGQSGDKKRTRDAGFDGHLVKPVDLAELNELLNQLFPDKYKQG